MSASLSLEPHHEASGVGRRFVVDEAGLDPMRSAEAALLVSELISDAVLAAEGPIEVSVDRRPERLTVVVERTGTWHRLFDDPLVSTLFERMARKHGNDGSTAWFEVRPPGAVAGLEEMSDDDLLARAVDDREAGGEVIRRFGSLATSLARRYRGKGVALDDLEQVALFALLKALSRYQPERGAFEAYASATISGELKRQLRDRAWSLRVPRSLQELALEVNRAMTDMSQRLGRVPSNQEVAEEIGVEVDDVAEARSANAVYWTKSLDMPMTDDDSTRLRDLIEDLDVDVEASGDWAPVASAMQLLPERERTIVYLRFFKDMTQSEIAETIGVSQMHVSRLLARSIDELRALTGASVA